MAPKATKNALTLDHPKLGTMVHVPSEDWWEARAVPNGHGVGFVLAGDLAPHPKSVQHAVEIIESFPDFNGKIKQFLQKEKELKFSSTPGVASDIPALVIEDICLYDPEAPGDGMIYFRGPKDDQRLWRCDYSAGQPSDLGFDSA